jgi:hypothetical protein
MFAAILITIVVAVQAAIGVVLVPSYRPPYEGGARSYHLVYRDDEPCYFWICIALQLLFPAVLWGLYLFH